MAKCSLFRFVVVCLLVCLPIVFCAPKKAPQDAKPEVDCNFDSGKLCTNWRQVYGEDIFDWTLRSRATPSSGTGPSRDYTSKNGNGYYAYIESSSPRQLNDKARLIGGPFTGVHCLQFAYSMLGSDIGQVNIYHVLHGTIMNIWSKKGEQGKNWKKTYNDWKKTYSDWKTDNATVYGTNYFVIFEGVIGKGYRGDIAIDGIKLVNGTCRGELISFEHETESANTGKCHFDSGLCGWKKEFEDQKSAWHLSSYRGIRKSRPDHGGSIGGKFIYAEGKQAKKVKSRLISQEVCGPKCVEYFYFLQRFKRSELRLSTKIDGNEDRIWFTERAGTQTEDWTRGVVEINAKNDTCFELIFESILSGDRKSISVVGLDDIFVANGSCCLMITTPEDSAKANCDFDKGNFCDWGHSMKSTFTWSLGSSQTKSGKESGGMTGPTKDVSGKGQYAYIESSEPKILGDKAILISKLLAGQQCMKFKYYMHGEDVASLSIYKRGILVWKEKGNHGDKWLDAQVDLDCSIRDYHIQIEATIGSGWRGDIAIDNLQFTPGLCPIESTNATTLALHSTLPSMVPPLPPPYRTCTFPQSLCSWTNALNDDGDWKIHRGDTPSSRTGPDRDFDGNGFYIYMEASDLFEGQEVRLESDEFRTPVCLQFRYQMFGNDVKELRLEQRNLKDNTTKVVWSKTGQQGEYWLTGFQNLDGEHYTVSFVAVRGNSSLGDIALDEISVNDAKECIGLNASAVIREDPPPDPKEGNCDFDKNGFCKWINAKGDNFDFEQRSGSTSSSGTGPTSDHTGKRGNYIFIETSTPRRQDDKAFLLVELKGRSLCMRFWYHMYGATMGDLKIMHLIKQRRDDQDEEPKLTEFTNEIWKKSRQQGRQWLPAEVTLNVDDSVRTYATHWIGIVAVCGTSYTGDLAVDDITFTKGPCPH